MVIYGASGHGKVILDCCKAAGVSVSGFKDKDPAKVGEFMGLPVWLEEEPMDDIEFIFGIGDNSIRKNLHDQLKAQSSKLKAQSVIHPTSIIADDVDIENGSAIFHNSVIQSGTTIGRHCIINTSASVDHDCIIGDFVHIAPNSTLSGGVSVGEGTMIGAGSTIIPNIKIGKWAVIGAGTVIIEDVPDFATVVGNPGKVIKLASNKNNQ